MRKLLQFPSRPAVVYLHFWAPTWNIGQWSFWNHTVQPGAQHPNLTLPPIQCMPWITLSGALLIMARALLRTWH